LEEWRRNRSAWRMAMLDTKLQQIQPDKKGNLTVMGSPDADSPEVVKRRGVWNKRLKALVEAIAIYEGRLRADDPTLPTEAGDATGARHTNRRRGRRAFPAQPADL